MNLRHTITLSAVTAAAAGSLAANAASSPLPPMNPPKIYQLNAASVAAPSPGHYWRLRKEIEATRGQRLIWQLTQRTLGHVIKVAVMTDEQLAKMIRVFEGVLKKTQPPNHPITQTPAFPPPPAMLPVAPTSDAGADAQETSGMAVQTAMAVVADQVQPHETPGRREIISHKQQTAAGEKRVILLQVQSFLAAGMTAGTAAAAAGISSATLSRWLAEAKLRGEEEITPAEACRRLLALPVEQLAPDRARGATSQFEQLAALPAVQKELARLYLLTIASSSEYMGAARRSGSAQLTLERFADTELCPANLKEKLRAGSRPKPLLAVIRRITAELEQRHRGQKHYQLNSITGRRSLTIELPDGTREPMPCGRVWVFDDMSTNWPFWFEAPAEAGALLGAKRLVERHGCGLGRQGLYGWDWGSAAWLGLESVGRVRDAYTADIILRFFRRLMQTYGKPDVIRLEQSVWKARSIAGFDTTNDELVAADWQRPDMEEAQKTLLKDGLRALGIRLEYTFTARGKPIEGYFNYLQTAFGMFANDGEGINIGRYGGEFERGEVAMRRAGAGVRHPAEIGFLHISRHADISWATMQWLNNRQTGAREGKPGELLAAALAANPLPTLSQRDLACFLPELRELQIRGAHVWPTVAGVTHPFIHPEHFADLGNGYLLSVKFDPAEPTLGAAIYNRDTSSRNHRGYAVGEFICWARLHTDAPAISLRDRSEDEGRQLIARYKRFHRTEYRALDLPKQQTVQIAETRDGRGNVATVERGGPAAATPDSIAGAKRAEARAPQTDLKRLAREAFLAMTD